MIQLRVRTEFTFGRTFAPIQRLVDRLAAMGCTAAGIVDDSGTWGHVPWFTACKAAGIQPILGVELVVADDDATQRMWFLAKNNDGLKELYNFSSKAHRQPVKTKFGSSPRLYREDVRKISTNVAIFAGDIVDEEFLAEVGAVLDMSPASRILNGKKRGIAISKGLATVDVSDNYYAVEEDRTAFEFTARGGLKVTPQHLIDLPGPQVVEEALAAECASLALPMAPMIRADGSDLEKICRDGIIYRGMDWNDEYEKRLQYELGLIRSKDFESYFIIVADMVHHAKERMLVGPSRGSAAGSLVCYTARITEINPIPPNLFFERFIDVSRTDLPDIDLDFPDDKRHIVFEYMAEKYGAANVAKIGTVSEFKPKSALIRVCKALNIAPQATASVKVAMIERSSADSRANNCLEDTFKTTEPGQTFIKLFPQAVTAQLLEGHASHTGVHAAGLLVCNKPITDFCTVTDEGIAQVEKGAAEKLGLLKIDVLGLRTLGILEDANVPVEWYKLPFDDPKTYAEVFNRHRYCGIFQFEGEAMRAISEDTKFETIVQIDAVTALARPGPFGGGVTQEYVERAKGKKFQALHPLVEPHMRETYGLPVYQEQTLAIVREIGLFDWVETSTIRKAMSKRMGKEFFDTYWAKFKAGAGSQGMEEADARKIWDMINSMGAWQMNKSHTYSYAVISYWTAYLKAHYPLEFAAANLRSAKDEDSALMLLREMVREGIGYVPFDVDRSRLNWSVQDGKLIGGFMALKGIGESKAAKLIEAREAGKLTDKDRKTLSDAFNIFEDIFPLQNKYRSVYEDPKSIGIVADKLWNVEELKEGIPHGEERVFIAELVTKNPRDMNEEILVKRREGKIETRALSFLDLRLRDDTGTIGGRISRWDYPKMGRELLEQVPIGSHMLIRAKFFNGIRYAFVSKWRWMNPPPPSAKPAPQINQQEHIVGEEHERAA